MKDILLVVTFLLILGGAVLVYQYLTGAQTLPADQKGPDLSHSETTGDTPEIRYPVPHLPVADGQPDAAQSEQAQTEKPEMPELSAQVVESPTLPPLDESDKELSDLLFDIIVKEQFRSFFKMNGFIRHFVVTIDNLTRKTMPRKHLVTNPVDSRFAVMKQDDTIYLLEENFTRYKSQVSLLEKIDIDKLVGIYIRYYPLFQEAYEDIGYPTEYFNDRLIEVIDHLLASPDVSAPIKLERPHVMYRFADPDLEAMSSGHKMMVRIGPVNATRVKNRLRHVRDLLTR